MTSAEFLRALEGFRRIAPHMAAYYARLCPALDDAQRSAVHARLLGMQERLKGAGVSFGG